MAPVAPLSPLSPFAPFAPIFPTEYAVLVVLSVYVMTIFVHRYWFAATVGTEVLQVPDGTVVPEVLAW